jgi:manganese transport protein
MQKRVDQQMPKARGALTLSQRTVLAARGSLRGHVRGLRSILPFVGPAVVASVAYMDPGNFATNIAAGARLGYDLLWVVLLASAIAMLFQALSAKLGIATGRSLAQASRECFPRRIVWGMWIASEVAAMATDLAEFLGGAIGLSLLAGLPLIAGMVVTGVVTYALLLLQRRGFRPIELVIAGLVAVIGLCYVIELAIAPLDWSAVAWHSLVPRLAGPDALTLAVGIIGATVMPHAIHLHSGLTHDRIVPRSDSERRQLIGFSNREVVVALGLAGVVNMAMVALAAAVFHDSSPAADATVETAYRLLAPLLGYGAAAVFLVSLIASGLSSSVVATMAGQIIMQDYVGFRIPLWLRRLVTMAPSFVVVALGANTLSALVLSQVVLSLVLPIPMIALLILTRETRVMGAAANGPITALAGALGAAVVLTLNGLLLSQACGISPADLARSPSALAAGFLLLLLLLLVVPGWLRIAIRPLAAAAGTSMLLTVIEHGTDGALIPRDSPASWRPRIVLPENIEAPQDPASGALCVALPADWLDSIGLRVSPPAGAAGSHLFKIVGTVDGGHAGEMSIAISAGGGEPGRPETRPGS